MSCGKYKKGMLCPFSFGAALGITSGLAVFICLWWVMNFGASSMMMWHMPADKLTLSGIFLYSLYAFIKGFIFGLVFALIYDLIKCCCKQLCCRKSGEGCQCSGSETCECGGQCGKCQCSSGKSNKPESK